MRLSLFLGIITEWEGLRLLQPQVECVTLVTMAILMLTEDTEVTYVPKRDHLV